MKILYVSHPFTGNEEENRKEARLITVALQRKYPKYHFYNPLDALQAQGEAGLDYDAILEHCQCIIDACDGVILTGNWDQSKGCMKEKYFAELAQKPVFESIANFEYNVNTEKLIKTEIRRRWP